MLSCVLCYFECHDVRSGAWRIVFFFAKSDPYQGRFGRRSPGDLRFSELVTVGIRQSLLITHRCLWWIGFIVSFMYHLRKLVWRETNVFWGEKDNNVKKKWCFGRVIFVFLMFFFKFLFFFFSVRKSNSLIRLLTSYVFQNENFSFCIRT